MHLIQIQGDVIVATDVVAITRDGVDVEVWVKSDPKNPFSYPFNSEAEASQAILQAVKFLQTV